MTYSPPTRIRPDKMLRDIVKKCYPDYTGRKFYLSANVPRRLDSYWSDCNRHYYVFYSLTDGRSFEVHSNCPGYEDDQPCNLDRLPLQMLLVQRSYYGRHQHIVVYANPEDLNSTMLSSGQNN